MKLEFSLTIVILSESDRFAKRTARSRRTPLAFKLCGGDSGNPHFSDLSTTA